MMAGLSSAVGEIALSPGRAAFPPEQAAAMKTAVAVESGLCNLICISQDGIYFEAMALDKRIK
jgi:hypothetical protein